MIGNFALLKRFLKDKTFILPLVFTAAAGFAYGISRSRAAGIDETAYERYYRNGGLIGQGRFFPVLIDKLTGLYRASPVLLTFLALVLLICSSAVFCVLLHKASEGRLNPAFYTVFSCLFITFPLISEYYIYRDLSFTVSLGFLMTAVSLLLTADLAAGGKAVRLLAASALMCFVMASYESLACVYLCGCAAVLIVEDYFIRGNNGNLRALVMRGLRLLIPLAAGVAAKLLVSHVLVSALGIASGGAAASVKYRSMGLGGALKNLVGSLFLDYVFSALCYMPVAVFLVAIALSAVMAVRLSVKRKSAVPLLLFAALLAGAFSLSLIQGEATRYRSGQAFAFYAAFVLAFFLQTVSDGKGKTAKRVLALAAVFLIVYQIAELNRWFYVDRIRYEEDVRTCGAIAAEIEAGGFDASKPVVFTGRLYPPDSVRDFTSIKRGSIRDKALKKLLDATSQTLNRYNPDEAYTFKFVDSNGGTMFFWGAIGERSEQLLIFFGMHGYRFNTGTEAMRLEANEIAPALPAWPENGSVLETGDYILVNLGNLDAVHEID